MYAVVKTGGKQYRVEPGATIQVEKIEGQPGQIVALEEVLLVADGEEVTLGHPLIEGAQVQAEIKEHDKWSKVIIYKYRRRKRYRRKMGHRQPFTALKIVGIQSPSLTASA